MAVAGAAHSGSLMAVAGAAHSGSLTAVAGAAHSGSLMAVAGAAHSGSLMAVAGAATSGGSTNTSARLLFVSCSIVTSSLSVVASQRRNDLSKGVVGCSFLPCEITAL
ncbi:MAG: hypothetical protein K0U36_01090 [Alphaproteobacteria bacterium]|nr:hypothetical protein [Alphaproteobacteria bacterium]